MSKSCTSCKYGSSKGITYTFCHLKGQLVDTRKQNYCSNHVHKKLKSNLKKKLVIKNEF